MPTDDQTVDIQMLTDSEITILMALVRSAKEWSKITCNADLQEKLKLIYDKLDSMDEEH